MAFHFTTKKGHKVVLRNPAEKGKRYARQLKNGQVAETGKKLSPTDRSFRIGYLTARSDNAKAHKSNLAKRRKPGRPKGSKKKLVNNSKKEKVVNNSKKEKVVNEYRLVMKKLEKIYGKQVRKYENAKEIYKYVEDMTSQGRKCVFYDPEKEKFI